MKYQAVKSVRSLCFSRKVSSSHVSLVLVPSQRCSLPTNENPQHLLVSARLSSLLSE